MTIKIIEIDPVTKPRMTRRDKWLDPPRPGVAKYRAFKDELNLLLGDFYLPDVFDVVFYVPCPPSWSEKKRKEFHNQPHQQTPDRDNLLKAFQDALLKSDARIYDGRVAKFWTNGAGYIVLEWV